MLSAPSRVIVQGHDIPAQWERDKGTEKKDGDRRHWPIPRDTTDSITEGQDGRNP
jgi:hypothetical protein